MHRLNAARKSESAPVSQTRPKTAPTRPVPVDETTPDTYAAIDAARIVDEYDAIRTKKDEFAALENECKDRLIPAMKAANKTRFGTMHGQVTLLLATDSTQIPDMEAAVALLEKHGISQPPTMEAWLAQHRLQMPMKPKAGMPDRIEFRKNK